MALNMNYELYGRWEIMAMYYNGFGREPEWCWKRDKMALEGGWAVIAGVLVLLVEAVVVVKDEFNSLHCLAMYYTNDEILGGSS
eukprot:scaffold215099_cov69-Cyclotella_meneghiniana.AAC.3